MAGFDWRLTDLKRKLAAILVADIAGYSRLMGIDETGTHLAFNGHLNEHIVPTIARFNGCLVKTLGDGILVTFESAVDAVQCADALQNGLIERNMSVPPDRQLRFRMGINLDDVMLDGGDVFGDGVNIAARIQSLADPDAILVSHSVMQYAKGKGTIAFEDLGEHRVKNISEPVRVFRATKIQANFGMLRKSGAGDSANPSIAVLPFVNMGGDPEQLYFTDGIIEDIITELSRFRTISVIARNSSFRYRDKAIDVKQVARELSVQFVVEGSVRRFDRRVRIAVQLINADTRRNVWGDRYDVELSDIFEVQDDIVRRIAAVLVPKIEMESLEMARRRPTEHVRAYDSYLRGKTALYAARDGEGIARARCYFEEAIAIDPEFASAYCYLAGIENNLTMYSAAGTSLAPFRDRAWHLALKAASLDENNSHLHICLAWCHLWRREFQAARKHLDIAARLNPNDADRAVDCGTTLMYLGEPEAAIAAITTGMRLNPFHPDGYLADLAEAYFVARRYDDMIEIAEKIVPPSPRFAAWKAAAYACLGRLVDARREADIFVTGVKTIWGGEPSAGPADYVAWLLEFSPFRRQQDLDHLVEGLRAAGLDSAREDFSPAPWDNKEQIVAFYKGSDKIK